MPRVLRCIYLAFKLHVFYDCCFFFPFLQQKVVNRESYPHYMVYEEKVRTILTYPSSFASAIWTFSLVMFGSAIHAVKIQCFSMVKSKKIVRNRFIEVTG